jgi:hypothetical protein
MVEGFVESTCARTIEAIRRAPGTIAPQTADAATDATSEDQLPVEHENAAPCNGRL